MGATEGEGGAGVDAGRDLQELPGRVSELVYLLILDR